MDKRKIEVGMKAIYVGDIKKLFGLECEVAMIFLTQIGVVFNDTPHSEIFDAEYLLPLNECGRARLTLALDFDDTIAHNDWPNIGAIRDGAKEAINQLHEDGHYIIINTCRFGDKQHEAESFLYHHRIRYNAINKHNPQNILDFQNDTRKISADVYVDDKNLDSVLHGLPEWSEIYRMINLVAVRKWLKTEYTKKCIPKEPAIAITDDLIKQYWINAPEVVGE
jgi:hypothetical protein